MISGKIMVYLGCFAVLVSIYLAAFIPDQVEQMDVESPAFGNGDDIPEQYTCLGEDISPPLVISEFPVGTKSFAIIVNDPDALRGDFVHWVAWNIDPSDSFLDEGPNAPMMQGINDFGELGYRGPCPPGDDAHRYFFTVYALDIMIDLPDGSARRDLEKAMRGHVLGRGQLMGVFQR